MLDLTKWRTGVIASAFYDMVQLRRQIRFST
jgi:hypothetical protein